MHIIKTLFVVLFLFLISFKCKNGLKENEKKNEKQEFVKDIPKGSRNNFIPSYALVQENLQNAELVNLENGFDSLCIRLWYIYSIDPFWQIVEIKKNEMQWNLEQTTIEWKYNYNDSILSFQRTKENKSPKSGWDYFIKTLLENKITTLPTRSKIPNYENNTDTDMIIVEISTKKYYRIYNYGSLSFNQHIKEAEHMYKIMELIQNEIGVEKFTL